MGIFWDLLQQSQLKDQEYRSESLERRVERLEKDLAATRVLLHALLQRMEQHFGEDLNRDGRIG